MSPDRKLPWDWYDGRIPENVFVHDEAYVETSFSFYLYRGARERAVEIGRGASTYLGTMFDVGPAGRVTLGEYALVHGARIICDQEVTIGDYALISWNVVLMDTHRLSADPAARRRELALVPSRPQRYLSNQEPPRPIRIERNVWIGFDSCILPGVTIGEGSIVGARSVVAQDVPPFSIAAGNPARIIRKLDTEERKSHVPSQTN
jgi:acetyltransferase-like isoleucine patch superfamily enzyme